VSDRKKKQRLDQKLADPYGSNDPAVSWVELSFLQTNKVEAGSLLLTYFVGIDKRLSTDAWPKAS
jgi:hypothetical protein